MFATSCSSNACIQGRSQLAQRGNTCFVKFCHCTEVCSCFTKPLLCSSKYVYCQSSLAPSSEDKKWSDKINCVKDGSYDMESHMMYFAIQQNLFKQPDDVIVCSSPALHLQLMPMMKNNINRPREDTSVRPPSQRGYQEKNDNMDGIEEGVCMKDGCKSYNK